MTRYANIFENKSAHIPKRMNKAEAADELRTIKYTCAAIGERGKRAIDIAIAALQPTIVPTIDNLIAEVSQATNIDIDTMLSKTRHREYSEARYMVYWLAYYYCGLTVTAIGRRFGRDHAIVIYGINKVDDWMREPRTNRILVERLTNIINRIKNNE